MNDVRKYCEQRVGCTVLEMEAAAQKGALGPVAASMKRSAAIALRGRDQILKFESFRRRRVPHRVLTSVRENNEIARGQPDALAPRTDFEASPAFQQYVEIR